VSEQTDPSEPVPGARFAPGWGIWLQVASSAACVALLAWIVDLRSVIEVLSRAEPVLLAAGVILAFADRFLMVGKWYPLLHVQSPNTSVSAAVRCYFAATFTNYMLPSSLGPDALRAAALGRPDGKAMEVGASIAAERLLGMVANILLVLVSAFVALQLAVPAGAALGLAGVLFVGTVLATTLPFSKRFRRLVRDALPERLVTKYEGFINRFVYAYMAYKNVPRTVIKAAALTMFEVCVPLAIAYVLVQAVSLAIPLEALIVAIPVAQLVAKVPISFAGLGTHEVALTSMLAAFGVEPASALAIAALMRATDVIIAIPGAFLLRDLAVGFQRQAEAPAP